MNVCECVGGAAERGTRELYVLFLFSLSVGTKEKKRKKRENKNL